MSALATIFGALGELSESELRQLYLAVGVRLGYPDGSGGGFTPVSRGTGKSGTAKKKTGGKTSKSSSSSKGNPQRKSQWANHPLYKEYSRLKKVVETQSKEQKCSFNAVDTAESSAYRSAFNQWLEAKRSFRGHGESGHIRDRPGKESDKGSASEAEQSDHEDEDEGQLPAVNSTRKREPLTPPDLPASSGKSRTSPTGKSRRK